MSLFQCESCGCAENTALSFQGSRPYQEGFDWTGKEELKGKMLCSACGPTHFQDGSAVGRLGRWHGQFSRVYLELGKWHTNREGNLENANGDTNYWDFAIPLEDVNRQFRMPNPHTTIWVAYIHDDDESEPIVTGIEGRVECLPELLQAAQDFQYLKGDGYYMLSAELSEEPSEELWRLTEIAHQEFNFYGDTVDCPF